MQRVKVYDLVKEILLDIPETRDSDQKLIYEVWSRQGFVRDGLHFENIHEFMASAHPKSIIENRRKIQRQQEAEIEEGVYIPDHLLVVASKEVLELREKLNRERGTHTFRDQTTLF